MNQGESIALSLSNAHVPGHPAATSFTYAFDCGDGAGYGLFSSTATAPCPAADGPSSRTVGGMVQDEDGDTREYTTTVAIANVAPTEGPITLPAGPVAISAQPVSASASFSGHAGPHPAVQ